MMEYKGYLGKVEFDDEVGIFHGEIINTCDVITFQGTSVDELTQAFHDSVDDYLQFCKQRGELPEQPCSGKLAIRISPELHRRISLVARSEGKKLNEWIAERLLDATGGARKLKTISKKKFRTPKPAAKTQIRKKAVSLRN